MRPNAILQQPWAPYARNPLPLFCLGLHYRLAIYGIIALTVTAPLGL